MDSWELSDVAFFFVVWAGITVLGAGLMLAYLVFGRIGD